MSPKRLWSILFFILHTGPNTASITTAASLDLAIPPIVTLTCIYIARSSWPASLNSQAWKNVQSDRRIHVYNTVRCLYRFFDWAVEVRISTFDRSITIVDTRQLNRDEFASRLFNFRARFGKLLEASVVALILVRTVSRYYDRDRSDVSLQYRDDTSSIDSIYSAILYSVLMLYRVKLSPFKLN